MAEPFEHDDTASIDATRDMLGAIAEANKRLNKGIPVRFATCMVWAGHEVVLLSDMRLATGELEENPAAVVKRWPLKDGETMADCVRRACKDAMRIGLE